MQIEFRIHKGMSQGELVSRVCSIADLSRILKSNGFLAKVSED